MVARTGPMNYQVQQLIGQLREKARSSLFWKRILSDIQKPSRQRRIVNLYKIEKMARDGEILVVPGKVLSVGELSKKVDVAALTFSNGARKKIADASGRAISISELLQENPDGKKVRILG